MSTCLVHWISLRFSTLILCLCASLLLLAQAHATSTKEERSTAWKVFLSARKNIVEQCIYRPKSEDIIWGAMRGLAKELGPEFAKYFPTKLEGSDEEAQDAFLLTLLKLDNEANLPFKTMVNKALRAYCRTVDRYSDYDDYETWAKLHEAGKFNFVGIAATLVDRTTDGYILNPFPDGPAEQAGVIAGDSLLEVGGKPVRGMSKEEIVTLCTGRAGTQVAVKVRHADGTVEDIEIVREKISGSPLVVQQNASGLNVACRQIFDQAVDDFRTLLRSQKAGRELTIDFRGCSGGTLTAAVNMASLFIPSDTMVGKLETVSGQEKLLSNNPTPFRPSRITILQDKYTASAAELVIVALVGTRNIHKIPIVTRGEQTHGKGVTEMQIELTAGAGGTTAGVLSITDTRIYGPNNEVWDGEGLPPTAPSK